MENNEIIEKAYNEGFYYWDKNNRKCYKSIGAYARGKDILIVRGGLLIGNWDDDEDKNVYYKIKDYGNKWALTEEELIENHKIITTDNRELTEKQINVFKKDGFSMQSIEDFVRKHTYKECSDQISKIINKWQSKNNSKYDGWYEDYMEGYLREEYCGGGH